MTTTQNQSPAYWHPVQHNMTRRSLLNNYHVGQKGYMVTLRIENMTPLLGKMVWNAAAATAANTPASVPAESTPAGKGSATAAKGSATVALSPLGAAMRQAWLTLPQRYSNVSVHDAPSEYVIMPEHFHGIIYVTAYMEQHLSEVVKLFKARVAMAYRKLLLSGQTQPVGTATAWLNAYHALPEEQQAATRQWVERQAALLSSAALSDATRRERQAALGPSPIRVVSSGAHNQTGFLFATGYTDSILLSEDNLEGHRQYILDNPGSRWLRTHNRALLMPNRTALDTAVTLTALEGYLRRECPPSQVTAEVLSALRNCLLVNASGHIVCHTYGDRTLLQRRLLPVVCHRKDKALYSQQQARCLDEAQRGAILVSACISPQERDLLNAASAASHPVIRIEDNGFPEIYHPSQERINLCAASQLLLVTPWQYHYRHKDEAIYTAYCKTMNCIGQALCRTSDRWWKAN